MSFAMEVKEEILSHDFTIEQKIMLLSGFIKYNGELIYTNEGVALKLTSNSNNVIRHIFSNLKSIYDGNIEISIIQIQSLKKNKIYQLMLVGNVIEFLTKYDMFDLKTNEKKIKVDFEKYNKKLTQELKRAYISGIFIAVGSVNSPSTSNYHLELQFKDKLSAQYISNLLLKYDFNFKTISKRNKEICYIKKSMAVSDFLKFMDASNSVINFESTRIKRDFNNNVNRMINIDIYNQRKSIEAGNKQIEEINFIKEKKQLNQLSEKAQVLAKLRLENPCASYMELEELMLKQNINITKSGISNLFKIISKFSNELGD